MAAEEAIVRPVESPAVERALARVLRGPVVTEAVGDALASPAVEAALVEALDSELVDRIWDRLLASDGLQRLVERIAAAPEVRSAIASQGVGLLDDLRREVRNVARPRRRRRGLRQAAAPAPAASRCDRPRRRGDPRAGDGARRGGAQRRLPRALGAHRVPDQDLLRRRPPDDVAIVVGAGFWAAAGSAYLLLFWAVAGQTPGMRFFGIRLLRGGAAGGIGARSAIRRLVGMVLAAIPLGLGFIGVLRAADRRGFHDRLAGTEVAYVPDVARAPWSILPADAVSAE